MSNSRKNVKYTFYHPDYDNLNTVSTTVNDVIEKFEILVDTDVYSIQIEPNHNCPLNKTCIKIICRNK